jgi:hypothetical protein
MERPWTINRIFYQKDIRQMVDKTSRNALLVLNLPEPRDIINTVSVKW